MEENASLIKEKDFVNNLIDVVPDVIVTTDEHANIHTMNNATVKLLGYKKEELLGKPVDSIFEEKKNFFKGVDFEKLLKEGAVYNYPLTCITNKGNKIKIVWSGAPILDKEKVAKGVVGIGRK